ncbi:Helix-turn-helix [Lachnospiraceae bacterium KH1T2]|nr:Helix-turn-helix [Lachnospiraceae bacterium KH1T2]
MKNIINEETLGQRIKAVRIRKGYTQEELAEVMHIPKSTVSAYENDKVDIKGSVLVELAEHLDTTPNYLLGCENSKNDFVTEAEIILSQIKDKKIQEVLLTQIRALIDV